MVGRGREGLFAELDLFVGEFRGFRRFVGGLEGALYFPLAQLFAFFLAFPLAATLRVTHTVGHVPTTLSSPAGIVM